MGFRPSVPPGMPPGYKAIMEACWSADPDERPSFDVVLRCLQVLHPWQTLCFSSCAWRKLSPPSRLGLSMCK